MTRRVRDRRPDAGASWPAVTAAPPRPGPATSLGRVGSSSVLGVELEPSLGAPAERRLERRAAGEPGARWGLSGELPVGIGGQVQPAGHTATGELVVPGGGELAGARF